jgi:polysaccharide chain length determinant protein (PEP-CTERM system associated)
MSQREWTSEDYIMMVRRRWPIMLVLAVVGGLAAYGVSRVLPNRYTSQAVVLVQQPTVPTDFVRSVVTAGVAERLTTMQQQILSRTRLEPIIKQLGLFSEDAATVSPAALVGRLQKAITVTPMRPPGEEERLLSGFSVAVTLETPQSAQLVCSTITSMFIEENLKSREQHSVDTTQFLSEQMVEAKAKLDEQDAKLAAFKGRYLGFLPEEVQTNLNLLAGLNSELDAATQALSRAEQDKSMTESMLTQQIAAWRASQSGRNPDTYQDQLAVLQVELATLQTKYTDDHPDVIKVKTEIAAVKKKIVESDADKGLTDQPGSEPAQFRPLRQQIVAFDQTIAAKTAQQARIQEEIKKYQERVQLSPSIEQQYKALTRDYQTALDSYNDLSKKRTQSTMATDLERDQEAEQFRIMDAASLPAAPSFPNRPLFGLGGFGAGLSLGMGIAFLLELRDTTLRTEIDVERALELPVLAMVPAIDLLSKMETDAGGD